MSGEENRTPRLSYRHSTTSPLEYKNPAFPVSLVISEYSISDIKVTLETQLSIGRDDEAVGNVRGGVIVTDILDDGNFVFATRTSV